MAPYRVPGCGIYCCIAARIKNVIAARIGSVTAARMGSVIAARIV
jgi:hypothetical protein